MNTNTNSILGLRGNTVDTREDSTSNTNYNLTFCKNKKNQSLLYDTALNYNPSTETLTVPNISTSGPLNASTINITDTDTAGTYYITFVDDSGNTKTLRCDKTTTPLTYNPNTSTITATQFNGNASTSTQTLTIDSTPNNSDFLLTCITPTPSTYNQLLYTDITYNPQTEILKVGKLDNCFALTSSGSNLPILFIDHTATGKQFLYNNANFYYNPTLGEFLLQGNTTTQNISASQLTTTGDVGVGTASPSYKLDVYDTTSFHCKTAVRSNDQTLEISSYYQAGVGQHSYLQSRQEATQTNYSNLLLNPSGGNVGIGLTNPSSALQVQGLKATTPATRGIHLGEDTADGNNSIEICQGSGTTGYIDFTVTGSDNKGRILYNHTTNQLETYTNSGVLGLVINSAGFVGIGTASPTAKLNVSGNFSIRNPAGQTVISMINGLSGGVWNFFTNYATAFDNLHIQNAAGGGGVYMSPGDTFWRAISDDRLKHNEVEITNGLDVVMKLEPVFYDRSSKMLEADFNEDLDDLGMTYYKESGFIAQQVYTIDELKHIVDVGDEERPWSIQYPQIISYNTGAIQQLKREKDELEKKVLQLETENTNLNMKYDALLTRIMARIAELEAQTSSSS